MVFKEILAKRKNSNKLSISEFYKEYLNEDFKYNFNNTLLDQTYEKSIIKRW